MINFANLSTPKVLKMFYLAGMGCMSVSVIGQIIQYIMLQATFTTISTIIYFAGVLFNLCFVGLFAWLYYDIRRTEKTQVDMGTIEDILKDLKGGNKNGKKSRL